MAGENSDLFGLLNERYIRSSQEEANSVSRRITTYDENDDRYKDIFKNELDSIRMFADQEKDSFKEIAEQEAKHHQLSMKYKNEVYDKEIKHYQNLYNLKNNIFENDKKATRDSRTIHEQIRDIYKNIGESGKVSIKDLADIHNLRQKEAKLAKRSIQAQQEGYEKFLDTIKTGITRVLTDFGKWVTDTRLFDQWKTGITKFSSEYESRFTEIAGRLGSDTREDTHGFIKDTYNTIQQDELLRRGLNFNNDVFPQITEAVKKGFQGKEAQDIAITQAIDKKIMPWLDTSSETWTQLQFDLTSERLEQIKGQQLLLQETREGNRILQNGVVSQITDWLIPSLDNIVANTTEVEDLDIEMQAKAMYLMNDLGYSKQEAMKAIQKEVNTYQNPFKAMTTGDTGDILLAMDNLNGTDMLGNFARQMYGTGWVGSGAFAELTGIATGGETRTERSLHSLGDMQVGQQKYIDALSLSADKFEKKYGESVDKIKEYITATQEHDNKTQNDAVKLAIDASVVAHGVDLLDKGLEELRALKDYVMKILIAMGANWATNGLNKLLSGNFLTGGKGFLGATQFGSTTLNRAASMGANNLGYGLTRGGFVGGVSQGGSVLSNRALSGAKAAGLGTAFTLGGVLAAGYGIKEGISDVYDRIKNNNTMTDREKTNSNGNIAGDILMTAGGAGMAAAGLGLASGPVGWIGLAAVGVGLLGKTIYDSATKIGGATAAIEEEYNKQIDTIKQTTQTNSDTLTDILGNLQDNTLTENELQVQKNKLIESGLLTDKDVEKAKGANKNQLEELTKAYLKATNKFGEDIESEMAIYEVESKNWSQDVWGNLEDTMQKWNDEDGNRKRDKDWVEAGSVVMNQVYSSLTKQINEGKTLDKDTQKIYDKIVKYMKDGYTSSELNKIIDTGAWNTIYQHLQLDPKTLNNIMTQLSVYDNNKAAKEMFDSMNNPNNNKNRKYNYYNVDTTSDAVSYLVKALNATNEDNAKEYLSKFKEAGYKLSDYKLKDETDITDKLENKWGKSIDLTQYRLGSSFIPTDMIAELHKGERVLTANQNIEYTEKNLAGNNSGIIQESVHDIVSAIQQQTSDIISFIRELSFNNTSYSGELNMSPVMGNTRVVL